MSENSSHRKRPSERQLRERKHKKLYSEDWALADDDIEGKRSFNLQEKLEDPAFAANNVVREMHGNELNVAYLQRHGFNTPLLFKEKTGLGLRVPTNNFSVNDVRMCVGSRRLLDVMDVNTQKNSEMTMKEWQRYYDDPQKDKLLNVISLEFSHTKLENYVQSPTIVRQVDWVDNVWPRHLKESQIEATNLLEDMKYPKVQKYCLMSVKGCYTDFHVDFGGTSVWYHILKGGKVFWLIPPNEHNLALYEKWVLSGKQSDVFFGDKVEKCVRITLQEGNTFFIPTGWIHAVYTPTDSLVFGGNFLHSYGIEKQLKIAQVEDNTKVPQKFRYPFFTEMLWYVLERYVHCLLGHSHLASGSDVTIPPDKPPIHMTHMELHGLKEIVLYLHMLPANRKNVPELIKDPVALIQDVRTLIGLHRLDKPDMAISGKPILWVQIPEQQQQQNNYNNNNNNSSRNDENVGGVRKNSNNYHTTTKNNSSGMKNGAQNNNNGGLKIPKTPCGGGGGGSGGKGEKKSPNGGGGSTGTGGTGGGGPRRRRTRCKKCEACRRSDCGECSFCLDMVKFGGPGRAKQTCNMRQCLQPMLPVTAACAHCALDGWNQTPVAPLQKGPQRCESASNLMECSVCYEIAHPHCVQRLCPDFNGYVNEDMPNSWECPMCCKLGKNADYRPRHFRARQKSCDASSMHAAAAAATAGTAVATSATGTTTMSSSRRLSLSHSQSSDYGGGGGGGGVMTGQNLITSPYNQENGRKGGGGGDENVVNNVVEFEKTNNNRGEMLPIKKRRNGDGVMGGGNTIVSDPKIQRLNSSDHHHHHHNMKKTTFRNNLAQQIVGNSSKTLKKASIVVRPAALGANMTTSASATSFQSQHQVPINNLALDKRCILKVFKYLKGAELFVCSLVCKTWASYTVDPSLWKRMEFSKRHITPDILKGIVRRQPEHLSLDWCRVSKYQLPWLLQRLTCLKTLSLISIDVKTAGSLKTMSSSCSGSISNLKELDLSFVSDLNDAVLRDILGPNDNDNNSVRGSSEQQLRCRFKGLNVLRLAGTDVTDVSMRYVTRYLPNLKELSLAFCPRITDAGIAQLSTKPANTVFKLETLDLSHSKLITETSLEHLSRCENLTRLDCRQSMQVSTQALIKFAAKSDRDLHVKDVKLVEKRHQTRRI